ncbi:MAG TPA: HD domain-containing phosphohydrolase, partial [Bacillota bacterium]
VERVLRYHWAPIAESIEAAGAVITLTDITAEREATRKLEQYDASIRTLAAAVDARDRYTHGHSERVSAYAVALGRRLGLSHHEIEDLRYGALLHDVGKIGIDDRILRKRGPLTAEERAVIMEHPAKGAAILAQAGAFASILPIVLYHHEWYNGGGYPTGRSGEAIPLGARITAVVDAFDAMTSRRHYRAELGVEEAIARLLEGRGVQFDPAIVDAFVAGLRDGSIPVIGRRDPPAPDLPVAAGEEPGRILPVHRQELQLIYRIALETRLLLDLGRFLPRVLGILSEVLAPDHAYIAMTEAPDRPPRIVAATGPAGGEGDAVAEGELADWVIRTGQPVLWSQGLCECSHLRSRDAATACSVAVPLIVQGQVVGALCCEAADPCAYDEDSLYLLKAVAAQLASAIEIARYHEQVRDAALRDGLTGVFNHTYFYEEAERALSEARRQGTPFSLAILDVNDMKMVNDRHGHLAGDEVLRYYAGVLKRHTPEHCTLARYGGDEFVVIMPATPRPEAEAIVRRMVQAFDRSIRWNGLDIPLLGMAWGVASYPGDGGRVTELLNAADMAMYGRKRRGRVVPFRMTADD